MCVYGCLRGLWGQCAIWRRAAVEFWPAAGEVRTCESTESVLMPWRICYWKMPSLMRIAAVLILTACVLNKNRLRIIIQAARQVFVGRPLFCGEEYAGSGGDPTSATKALLTSRVAAVSLVSLSRWALHPFIFFHPGVDRQRPQPALSSASISNEWKVIVWLGSRLQCYANGEDIKVCGHRLWPPRWYTTNPALPSLSGLDPPRALCD